MGKLMIVDDEPDVCEFARNFFTKRKLDVVTAANGLEAINIAKEFNPDVVLLDIRMQGMDGIEVLKKIKEINQKIRVFMVTGVNESEAMQKAKELGAKGYIHKPLILDELEKIVMKEFKK